MHASLGRMVPPRDASAATKESTAQTTQEGARPARPDSVALHEACRGKVQMAPACPIRSLDDFAVWYTPGVADACRAIVRAPERVFDVTNRANTIAIVSDGSRVLGLGDIGPEAALPVMEGKSLLFKYLGGVDAVPLCVNAREDGALVAFVRALEPSFGGVNLEDIAQPKCFDILERLQSTMKIPVWHDDQQGTAAVVVAALTNALDVVKKRIDRVRIALIGCGAANVASYRLLRAAGIDVASLVACDTRGTLHRGRRDVESDPCAAWKWRICRESNERGVTGGVGAALRDADVCLAFSTPGPHVIDPEWIRAMAKDAIVFACANPTPEIWPEDALRAGAAIVATGRSDFPNQVNNALAFPGIFRGILDVRARAITDEMALAASRALGRYAVETGIRRDRILPSIDDEELVVREAVAVARAAIEGGLAALDLRPEEIARRAARAITTARASLGALMDAGLIPRPHT